MKNTALYYLNLLALPLYFIVALIANMYRAVRCAKSETASVYQENRRYFKQGE